MKGCPRCKSLDAWVLGDGRSKCQSCGCRYRWKSVWDSVRLSEATKHELLSAFVRGLPAARSLADSACADSRERFYRLVRACCFLHERPSHDGLSVTECLPASSRSRTAMRGWSTLRRVLVIGFVEKSGRIQIVAPSGGMVNVLPQLRERTAVGGVLPLDDHEAGACLQVQGEYVIVPTAARAAMMMNPAEAFWRHVRLHLQMFRKIPLKFFQLYLAEACLRFNQRDQDLYALLRKMMETTVIDEVKPLLLGEPVRCGQDPAGFPVGAWGTSQHAAS